MYRELEWTSICEKIGISQEMSSILYEPIHPLANKRYNDPIFDRQIECLSEHLMKRILKDPNGNGFTYCCKTFSELVAYEPGIILEDEDS